MQLQNDTVLQLNAVRSDLYVTNRPSSYYAAATSYSTATSYTAVSAQTLVSFGFLAEAGLSYVSITVQAATAMHCQRLLSLSPSSVIISSLSMLLSSLTYYTCVH